jgi:hypothetical protein
MSSWRPYFFAAMMAATYVDADEFRKVKEPFRLAGMKGEIVDQRIGNLGKDDNHPELLTHTVEKVGWRSRWGKIVLVREMHHYYTNKGDATAEKEKWKGRQMHDNLKKGRSYFERFDLDVVRPARRRRLPDMT